VSTGILEGLSVLELGRLVAAPYCGKLLADLGADVLKLEQPGAGDPARGQGPFPDDVPHRERSALFLYLNTNKRSITLEIGTETGRAIFRRLVSQVDVLIEDCAPGELEALELDYPRLSELNPRLIVTSITPYGTTGPYRDYRTRPLNVYHASGQTSFGYTSDVEEERAPPKAGGQLGEYDVGLTSAVGTMAAVLGRGSSGRGQQIEVSKLEALMCLERVDIGRLTDDPNPPSWRGGIGGMMKAKDGYFIITPVQDHQWQGLIRAMGSPEWAQQDWSKDESARFEHAAQIRPRLDAWAAELTRDEIYHRLQEEGVPAGPVRSPAEALDSPQSRARGYFAELEHPEAGAHVYPTAPHLFSDAARPLAPAPLLGQHNADVYCGELGYGDEDLPRLAASGVI
jgi:crotonobetainyl-CoA:carnitine CoA-transferase CaiB-like acyl-CoA transferase